LALASLPFNHFRFYFNVIAVIAAVNWTTAGTGLSLRANLPVTLSLFLQQKFIRKKERF
jgi:hypothetical protein